MAVALTFDVVSDAPTYSDIDIRWAKPDNPAAAAAGDLYRDECYSAANCTGTSGTRQTMEVASWVTWPDSGDYYFWAVDDDARGGTCDKAIPGPYKIEKEKCEDGSIFMDGIPGTWTAPQFRTSIRAFYLNERLDLYDGDAAGGDFHIEQVCQAGCCLLYTSPSPRDVEESRMPSSA